MARFAGKVFESMFTRCFVALLFVTILAGASYAQTDDGGPQVGEGCLLYRSPISGRYESVPLVHTDAAVDVRGLVAAVTVTQQYVNSSTEPIEAVYVFPLPHDAAVYDMEIRIGDRVIRSQIREREEAKRVYEAAKSQGKRAALLEEERPNIFTASVANIMPNDHVDVRLRYVQPLRWDEGRLRLVFPMVVGPRYIPGTQAIDHTGSGWSFESVKSISHDVSVNRLADGRQHVELTSGATIPDKDFVLELQQAESSQPSTALFLSPGKESAETHFLLAAFPPSVVPTQRPPVEMLYMIDVSGSMPALRSSRRVQHCFWRWTG